jgi:hypothetical protein
VNGFEAEAHFTAMVEACMLKAVHFSAIPSTDHRTVVLLTMPLLSRLIGQLPQAPTDALILAAAGSNCRLLRSAMQCV